MNLRRFGLLAATLVAINLAGLLWIRYELAGRGRPSMRILSVLPADDVDHTDRFSLLFDEPLSAMPGLANPAQSCPFVIRPQPKGHWSWSAPDRLEFLLDEPLPPGRAFVIKPAANLQTQTGRVLIGQQEYRLQTRPLRLESCQVATADRKQITLEVSFNQPVAPADLLRHLELTDAANSRSLRPTCLTGKPDAKLVIRCNRPAKDKIQVRIQADLTGSGAELPLGEDAIDTLDVPLTFCLLRATAADAELKANSTVSLTFSQDLDTKQAVPSVELKPAVKGMQTRFCGEEVFLEGPFEAGRKYTASVGPEVKSAKDERLGTRQSVTFEVPDRSPCLAFPVSQGTLMPGGRMQVDLKAVNVAGLKLTAHRIYANNLVPHVRGQDMAETSRQLWEKTFPLNLARNTVSSLALDLRDLLGGGACGVYVVQADATDHSWTHDQVIATVSDLAITVKQEQAGCLVWVTSLRTAKPQAGVQVAGLTRTNQTLATATTDEQGLARLAIPQEHPDGSLYLVTAQSGDDLNYLLPEEHAWVIDRIDQSGKPYPDTYDVMLYTERGIYRPGDTIHLTGLIRDKTGQIPAAFPLALTVERPDGKKVEERVVSPNPDQQGFFQADFATAADGQLGRYLFTASLPGDKDVLGQMTALVEEYVPVRLEVRAEPTRVRFGAGDTPSAKITARYLFGQPASQLPLKVRGTCKKVSYKSNQFADYTFTDPHENEESEIADKETTLDDAGQATVELPLDDKATPGCWQAKIAATVSELGGRSVSARTRLDVDSAPRHIGLLAPQSKLLPADQPIHIDWVQVTPDDGLAKPVAMTWTLNRVDYDTTLENVAGRMVWKSEVRLTPISKGEIPAPEGQPKGSFEVTCLVAGFYRLEVADSDAAAITRFEFYATSDISQDQTMAMNEPERLDIVLDQEKYAPGSLAKVQVTSPFAGTLLLTLECDRVVSSQIISMEANTASLELPIPQDLRGGAFLAASVVRGVDPSKDKWLPHRAAGLARVVIDHRASQMPLIVEAPRRAQPREKVKVTVKSETPRDAGHPACIHLWAVDEGILQTIGYKTPDPLRYFLAPHERAVTSADAFGALLPDYQRPAGMTHIGGDGRAGGAPRHSLVPPRRRAAAVIWRTIIPVGEDGTASIEVELPDLTGEIRFMAVVVDQDRYGSAQQATTVTAPLLVETTWPRFAAPGDRFRVPVKVFNTTDGPLEVTLSLAHVEGPVEVKLPAEPRLTVQPNQPVTTWLEATATGMGQVAVHLQASAIEEGDPLTALSKADLPIRPAAALDRQVQMARVHPDQPLKIAVPDGFIPAAVRATVSVAARPIVHMQSALEQLIDYPYGCVEQTTSRLLVLLYAPDLLADCPQDKRAEQIGRMIDAGIARLWSMQTLSGGLGYWPGDRDPNLWGTCYAAGFLLRARQAGYHVDKRLTDPLVEYLAAQVQKVDEHVEPNVRALLCNILAGFGKPPAGWIDRLAERTDKLDIAGRADLAAAFLTTGRKDRALTILESDTLEHSIATTTSGRLTSQVQQDAQLLHLLLDLDPNHAWIVPLVQRLQKAAVDGRWGSTLENATALSALCRYQLTGTPQADFTGTVRTRDEEVLVFGSTAAATGKIKQVAAPIEIATTGTGDAYVCVLFEGLLQQGQARQYDHQLTVRRRWLDRSGKPIDPAALKVGDLVCVEIELATPGLTHGETVDNLAVVDALPGGLEVENPRLATSAGASASATEAKPQRVEFRDDRVLLFTSAGHDPRVFRYSLRAVTAGSFILPPVEASCMYDPQFASLSGGGRTEVVAVASTAQQTAPATQPAQDRGQEQDQQVEEPEQDE